MFKRLTLIISISLAQIAYPMQGLQKSHMYQLLTQKAQEVRQTVSPQAADVVNLTDQDLSAKIQTLEKEIRKEDNKLGKLFWVWSTSIGVLAAIDYKFNTKQPANIGYGLISSHVAYQLGKLFVMNSQLKKLREIYKKRPSTKVFVHTANADKK